MRAPLQCQTDTDLNTPSSAQHLRGLAFTVLLTTIGACSNQPVDHPKPQAGEPPTGRELIDAVRDRDYQLVSFLLDRGAPINWCEQHGIDSPGLAPLHHALYDRRMVKVLLERGAYPDVRDSWGGTPLHHLAHPWRGPPPDAGLAKMLIDAGAQANARTNLECETPLLLLCWAEQPDVEFARVLLDAEADPGAANTDGETPLQRLALRNCRELVNLLIDHQAPLNTRDAEDYSLLWSALYVSEDDDHWLLRRLIEAGADIDLQDARGRTLLREAVDGFYDDEARLLVRLGADPELPDAAGVTPVDAIRTNAVRAEFANELLRLKSQRR